MSVRQTATRPLTREQCRAVDRYAIEELGIAGIVLMENAGRNAADLIETWVHRHVRRSAETCDPSRGDEICIVCGKGNNGGDGLVIARHLVNRGHCVCVDLAAKADELGGDAAVNHHIVQAMGIAIREISDAAALQAAAKRWGGSQAVIDALLGTGFAGEVREPLAGIIEQINRVKAAEPRPLVIAIDVPSGLDADTGEATGPAVRADRTITLLASKQGYQKKTARAYLGRVTVADIGAPTEWILDRLAIA